MKTLKEHLNKFEQLNESTQTEKQWVEELDILDNINKPRTRKYDEDMLGNKLHIGDVVYVKSSTSNAAATVNYGDKYGIIYKISEQSSPFNASISVYFGKNKNFHELENDIINSQISKDDLLNSYIYKNDLKKSISVFSFSPEDVVLVLKANKYTNNTLKKLK